MTSYGLKNRTGSSNQEVHGIASSKERDDTNLERLGKKPVLKVLIAIPFMECGC